MRNYFIKSLCIIIFSSFFLVPDSYPWPNGISQRTKKNTTLGCSNCHYFATINSAFFSGPDTVYKGQSVLFTLTINRSSTGKAGLDIAAQNGLLDTIGGGMYLKTENMELIHKDGIVITGSVFSVNFLYVAPNYEGFDTLYGTFNIGYTGKWRWVPNKVIVIKQPIGIWNNTLPVSYELYQNYPNPFNPYTIISYALKYNTFVNLDVYNIEGKLITTLVNGYQESGRYSIPFSVSNYKLASGVYYYRFTTDKSSEVKSMMLIK